MEYDFDVRSDEAVVVADIPLRLPVTYATPWAINQNNLKISVCSPGCSVAKPWAGGVNLIDIMLTKLRGRWKRQVRFTTTLRETREAQGLTRDDLAQYCEVSVETIGMIEEGKYEPSVVLAEKLAVKLGVSVEALFVLAVTPDVVLPARDERIALATFRYGYALMIFLVFGSLIAANVLMNWTSYEEAGEAMFAVWAVGAVLFIAFTIAVRGSWSFMRTAQRKGVSAKYRVISSIVSGIFFGGTMTFWVDADHPTSWRIQHGIWDAVFFGLLMYFVNYYQGRSKAKKLLTGSSSDSQ